MKHQMPPLKIAVQMQAASRLRNDDVILKFHTAEEVANDLFALIDNYRKMNGWLLFGPDKFKVSDLPKNNAVAEKEHTPSQELRHALYALHMKRGGNTKTWPVFYERQMTRIKQTVIDAMD